MANDEVILKFGTDQTAVARGLRGMKGMMEDFKKSVSADSIWGGVKGGLASLGIGLTASAFAAGAKAAMDYAEGIKTLAETVGTSTDYVQHFGLTAVKSNSNIEAARTGLEKFAKILGAANEGSEEAQEKLKKYGITATDTETAISQFTKTLADMEDPTRRVNAVVQLFGKNSEKLVATLMEFERTKGDSGGLILSKNDIAVLDAAGNKIDSLWAKTKTLGAKLLSIALTPFDLSGSAYANLGKPATPDREKTKAQIEAEIKAAKDYAAALQDVYKARRELNFAGANEIGKLQKAYADLIDAEMAYKEAKDGTIEKLKAEKELLDKQKAVTEAKNAVEKKALEEQKKLQKDVTDAALARANAKGAYYTTFADRTSFSLGDLVDRARAKIQRFGGRSLGRGDRMALDIDALENQAKEARYFGRTDLADSMTARALDLRKAMSGVLTSSESDPMKAMREGVVKTSEKMEELTTLAKTSGIKIEVKE